MDIGIFAVIFIFILIIPFFLFRRVYFLGGFINEIYLASPLRVIIFSVIPGFILHATFLLLILKVPYSFFDIDEIKAIYKALNESQINDFKNINEGIEGQALSKLLIKKIAFYLFHYNLFLWIYVAFVAYLSRMVVRGFKLDHKRGWLRFKNHWYYFFSGEVLDFPEVPGQYKDVDFVWVDVMTKVHGDCMIYSGVLISHQMDFNTSRLDSISLIKPLRKFVYNRKNKNYDVEKSEPIRIPGDLLIIPYVEIYNINISYYNLDEIIDYEDHHPGMTNKKVEAIKDVIDVIKKKIFNKINNLLISHP